MAESTNSRYRYLAFKTAHYRRYRSGDKPGEPENILPTEVAVHGSYGALLFDPRWRSKRTQILQRDAHACVICSAKEDLQVHHRQYQFVLRNHQFRPPWDYDNEHWQLCLRLLLLNPSSSNINDLDFCLPI